MLTTVLLASPSSAALCNTDRIECDVRLMAGTFVLGLYQAPPLRPVGAQNAIVQVLQHFVRLRVLKLAQVISPGSKRARRLQYAPHLLVERWQLKPAAALLVRFPAQLLDEGGPTRTSQTEVRNCCRGM